MAGGLTGIIIFLPISAVIAIVIKLTSPGPVIFKQIRIGENGRKFYMYKFRTMYCNLSDDIHRNYVSQLIQGKCRDTTYKIVDDPRITRAGNVLRKLSFDEIPQFVNVLKGEMSLVGPRPALPYEFEQYQKWHRERIFSIKPGITGLWQVEGRSRTTFDEMVRMDLRYKESNSLFLDIKILCKTILVLFSTKGGY
ncbi:MAG: sugar transferase [Chitinispirillaceae bacterium]|nr:sugar transferase [Chitinispirillaceae bacterium]